ncbi:MAG: hypothetical protein TREMPRED_002975 [Tremellales sp. Tagirdzhanova-0007]|nr:MAG: hypothetical protein TREMPRED_002975 [Tremellales sp. Tagirdzhanova-0007]
MSSSDDSLPTNKTMAPITSEPDRQDFHQTMIDVNAPQTIKTKMPEGHAANNIQPAAGTVAPSASSSSGGPPKLDKYAYSMDCSLPIPSVMSPEMAHFRKILFKILLSTMVLLIVLMWTCFTLYWGSLWKSNKYTNKLTVRIIDRDGAGIGSYVSQGLLSETNLRYFVTSPNELPTQADVEHDLVEEGAWAAVIIMAGATNALNHARSVGNASYNASSAIQLMYPQARQETAFGSYLIPYAQAALGAITEQYSAQSAAQYILANARNVTAMNLLARAPTTISNCLSFTSVNIRPYNQPVASAITLVGLIYMTIFAFIITMTNSACREIIAPFLTTRAYIAYRLIVPLVLYLVISFFLAMINLPFKVDFGAHYTYAGGFFLWAFTLFLGMSSQGLATEFAITLIGPKFVSFFLIMLIIANVSVVALPSDLQPWIFRYGVAMPFSQLSKAVRTIIFNTKNEVARNLGILLSWVVVSLITIAISTWATRRKAVNAHRQAMVERESNEKDHLA